MLSLILLSPFLFALGYVLAYAIRKKHKIVNIIAMTFWFLIGLLLLVEREYALFLPYPIDLANFWFYIRALASILLVITIFSYLILNNNILFWVSIAISIFIVIEILYCNLFGFYGGP